jgi:hypothetical protein
MIAVVSFGDSPAPSVCRADQRLPSFQRIDFCRISILKYLVANGFTEGLFH